ncbi:unnamed protein product, partial [marine sediment metagenome]
EYISYNEHVRRKRKSKTTSSNKTCKVVCTPKRKRRTKKKANPGPPKKRIKKKARMPRDRLTGGSGDVNPQLYSGKAAMLSENAAITLAFISPVSRGLPAPRGKAVVMEILRIFVDMPDYAFPSSALGEVQTRLIAFGTRDIGTEFADFSFPTMIAKFADQVTSGFTAAGTSVSFQPSMIIQDLTDGAGHGVLVASDYIYVSINTEAWSGAATYYFKILYRFKTVNLTEYIGIVQSQS